MKYFFITGLLLISTNLVFAAQFNKRVAVYKPDSTVEIINPSANDQLSGETDTEFLTRVYQETTEGTALEGLPYDIISLSDLPDREDREAWEGTQGSGVEVDLPKAQALKKAKRRENKIKERADKNIKDTAEAELIAEGEIE